MHRAGLRRYRVPALLASAAASLALASPAAADTYTPNRHGDHAPNGCTQADCTVREGVIRANNHAGPDTIVLRGGHTYELSIVGLGEQAAQAGDLDINSEITIRSSNNQLATINQAPDTDRVFETGALAPAPARLVGLRISGGNGGPQGGNSLGGGMLNAGGTLSVVRCRVVNNKADEATEPGWGGGGIAAKDITGASTTRIVSSTVGDNSAAEGGGVMGGGSQLVVLRSRIAANNAGSGGGIQADYYLRLDRSTVADNRAIGYGGGLRVDGPPVQSATITNSTISGNRAGNRGGGVNTGADALLLKNVTIAANRTPREGGGIVAIGGTTSLRSVTVARNRADSGNLGADEGGGLSIGEPAFATVNVRNSLIVLNRATNAAIDDCGSQQYISGGHNILTTTCQGFNSAGDVVLAMGPPNPAGIGQLGHHGGPTQTIPLLAGSPAIGHAGQNAPFRDQRGVRRDDHPDTGAFERR